MKFKSSLFATSAIICGTIGAVPAIAQAQDANQQGQLGEIIVTAQKREQALVDVPATVASVQADQLESAGINSVAQLPQLVPGLRVDRSGGWSQPTIRGVGTAVAGTGFSSNVASYTDGFYNPSQLSTDSLFLNIESIDVLKGPQGTLFGRNATGGAILTKLRDPSATPTIEARAAYSSYNTMEGAFYGSTGVTDTLAVDFSAAIEDSDGFTDNILTGKHADSYTNYALRGSALWTPTDTMSFKLAANYANQDDGRPYAMGVIVNPATGTPAAVASLLGATVPTKRGDVAQSGKTRFKSDSWGVNLTSKFDLGFAELTSYTQYRKEKDDNYLDLDSSPLVLQEGQFFNDIKTFTQEFNLAGQVDKLDYVLGAFYIDTSEEQNPFFLRLNGGPPLTYYAAKSDVTSWAAFADVNYKLTDKLTLIAGIRYSEEKPEAIWTFGQILAGFEPFFPGTGTKFSHKFHSTTPRLGLSYALTDDSNIYATFSKGFKAGLLTPNSFTTTPLKPENIKAYEVGYKYSGGRNRFETAAFYYDYTNLQVANYINGSAVYENAASSEIYGAEASLTSLLTDALEANAGVSYVHAEYDEYNGTGFVYDPATGTFPNAFLDLSGLQAQRSPKWTANLGLTYTHQLPVGSLKLVGNYSYTSKFPFDAANRFFQDAYGILNLKAAWRDPSDKWELAVFGNNVTDEKYTSQLLPGIPAIQRSFGRPATVGVSVSFKQ